MEIQKDINRHTTINFIIKNEKDEVLASMSQNEFYAVSLSLHDLSISASANQIKIWLEKRRLGLEFRYSRKTLSEIENIIQNDTPDVPDYVDPPAPIDNLEEFYDKLSKIEDFLPEIAAIGQRRNDPVGTAIRWHAARYIDSDGKIAFLDFISCRLYNKKKCVEFRNGKLNSESWKLEFCAGNSFNF
ncbi:MAG: hypothetical protein AB1921_12760 [Thermodesulfobacteriota bacterium]